MRHTYDPTMLPLESLLLPNFPFFAALLLPIILVLQRFLHKRTGWQRWQLDLIEQRLFLLLLLFLRYLFARRLRRLHLAHSFLLLIEHMGLHLPQLLQHRAQSPFRPRRWPPYARAIGVIRRHVRLPLAQRGRCRKDIFLFLPRHLRKLPLPRRRERRRYRHTLTPDGFRRCAQFGGDRTRR